MLNGPVPPENVSQPKEMLTCTKTPTGHHVRINYSSLELIQTCLRKAHYSLNRKLRQDKESEALAFGSSIHKALEYWYQLDVSERELPRSLEEDAKMLAAGHALDEPARHGALEAIRQFVLCRQHVLAFLPDNDKRSLMAGVALLKAYFKHYANDGFVVAKDANGAALVERFCSARMYDTPHLKIDYFGTVDCVLQNTQTGMLMVADHKTTAALGKEFYDRCKPNPQYTGYVWLAREALGIDTRLFMINGIQVAKTKTEFARQITDRTDEDFQELRSSVVHRVSEWIRLTEHDSHHYPMTAPNPCSMYSGCTYRKVCEVPDSLKENVIQALFTAKTN